MPPRKDTLILLYSDENILYMQALQMDEKINTRATFETKPLESEQNSKITWQDLRGLSWLIEDEF